MDYMFSTDALHSTTSGWEAFFFAFGAVLPTFLLFCSVCHLYKIRHDQDDRWWWRTTNWGLGAAIIAAPVLYALMRMIDLLYTYALAASLLVVALVGTAIYTKARSFSGGSR